MDLKLTVAATSVIYPLLRRDVNLRHEINNDFYPIPYNQLYYVPGLYVQNQGYN